MKYLLLPLFSLLVLVHGTAQASTPEWLDQAQAHKQMSLSAPANVHAGLWRYAQGGEPSGAWVTGGSGEVLVTIHRTAQPLLQSLLSLPLVDGVVTRTVNRAALLSAHLLPDVIRIEPVYKTFQRSQGSVHTEGVEELSVAPLLDRGITGAGVKIGVISDGVASLDDAVATGELPAGIEVNNPCPTSATVCDEGTAMLEIIHDMAPQADLAFCGVSDGESMIECIDWLIGVAGVDIVVDDVWPVNEPVFEDGPVALRWASYLDEAILVSAAGNSAENHYRGDYSPMDIQAVEYQDFHAFDDDLIEMKILVPPGQHPIILQWAEPFGQASTDYDLFVVDESGNVLAQSSEIQDGDDDAFEGLVAENTGSDALVYTVAVGRYQGQALPFKIITSGVLLEFGVAQGSIWGHPAVEGVLAVGAFNAGQGPNAEIAPYSSQGPVQLAFPNEVRQKPDFVAIDGVQVSGVGGFTPPFYGTSAAAPHAAAILGLMKGAFPDANIVGAMVASAQRIGTSRNASGAGRIDALAAMQFLNTNPVALIESPDSNVTLTAGETFRLIGRCEDPDGEAVTGKWLDLNNNAEQVFALPAPGDVTLRLARTYMLQLVCTDAFGESGVSSTRMVTVNRESSVLQSSTGGGSGGGCTLGGSKSNGLVPLLFLSVLGLCVIYIRKRMK